MTDLHKAGSGSVWPEIFNAVVDALRGHEGRQITAAAIDSQAAQDGDVLTADGAGGAAWEAGGGSQPGAVIVVERTFAQIAGGGHTYTATFDLPTDSRLVWCEVVMLTDWDGGADIPWTVGDEDAPNNIFDQGVGFQSDGAQRNSYKATDDSWGGTAFSIQGAKSYPSGQTITAAVTDVTGGTGTAVIRFYYFVAPATAAAVVT